MNDFTPIPALIGGALVGVAASLFLMTHGKVAGISGLYGGLFRPRTADRGVRLFFILGLLFAGLAVRIVFPSAFATTWTPAVPTVAVAGLLVGFGTQLGNGCTSGHGVCGISRVSVRSILATCVFMATGMAAVFVARHVIGAGR